MKERYLSAKRALFDKAYSALNDKQREAVYAVDHPLLILAGAGSGKTTVLVKRIGFILKYGNAYHNDQIPMGLCEGDVERLESALALSAEEIMEILPEFSVSPYLSILIIIGGTDIPQIYAGTSPSQL